MSVVARSARWLALAAALALAACGGHDQTSQALSLSGTISGLTASGLVLSDSYTTISVSAGASTFSFGAALSAGQNYVVTVQTQPSGEICSVANGSGQAGNANIANVVVTCATSGYTLGGSVNGLAASDLLLLANGSDTLTVPASAGSFTMPMSVSFGSQYSLSS